MSELVSSNNFCIKCIKCNENLKVMNSEEHGKIVRVLCPICNANNIIKIPDDTSPVYINYKIDENSNNPQSLLNNYKSFRSFLTSLLNEQDKLQNISGNIQVLNEKEKELKEKIGLFGKIGGLLSFAVAIFGLIGGGFVGLIVGIILGFITFLIFAWIDEKTYGKKRDAKVEELHQYNIDPELFLFNYYKKRIDDYWDSDIMSKYERMIPEEYREIEVLDFFIRALEIGRATTNKELYNLYEEELHRKNIERMQKQQLENTENALKNQSMQLEMQKKQLNQQINQNILARKQINQLNDISNKQRKISRQVRYGNAVNTLNLLGNNKK